MTSLARWRYAWAAPLLLALTLVGSNAVSAQSSATAKRDSVARADSIKKAVAKKQADDKAAANKAAAKKRADEKAAATKTAATKEAAAKTSAGSTSSKTAAPTTKATGSATSDAKPAAGSGSAKPSTQASSKGSAAPAGRGKTAPTNATKGAAASTSLEANGPARGVYAGMSSAGLGFGSAPVVGVAWRLAAPTSSLSVRADLIGARYGQTASPLAGAPPITERASLTHVGATLSAVLHLSSSPSLRPYVILGGGVFRFQASGQAGGNGTIANGVFASTTDVAGIGGIGLQLSPRFTIEGRYVTVGDFHTLPLTIGVRF